MESAFLPRPSTMLVRPNQNAQLVNPSMDSRVRAGSSPALEQAAVSQRHRRVSPCDTVLSTTPREDSDCRFFLGHQSMYSIRCLVEKAQKPAKGGVACAPRATAYVKEGGDAFRSCLTEDQRLRYIKVFPEPRVTHMVVVGTRGFRRRLALRTSAPKGFPETTTKGERANVETTDRDFLARVTASMRSDPPQRSKVEPCPFPGLEARDCASESRPGIP